MQEHQSFGLNDRADMASDRAEERQARKDERSRIILKGASHNLSVVDQKIAEYPVLDRYFVSTGKSITFARRLYIVSYGSGYNPVLLPTISRIAVDNRGVFVQHEFGISFLDGTFDGKHGINTELTTELLERLQSYHEAESLIAAFSKLTPEQIDSKLSRGIK